MFKSITALIAFLQVFGLSEGSIVQVDADYYIMWSYDRVIKYTFRLIEDTENKQQQQDWYSAFNGSSKWSSTFYNIVEQNWFYSYDYMYPNSTSCQVSRKNASDWFGLHDFCKEKSNTQAFNDVVIGDESENLNLKSRQPSSTTFTYCTENKVPVLIKTENSLALFVFHDYTTNVEEDAIVLPQICKDAKKNKYNST